eukprot:360762-Chlamydomonas_euryale.AAC.9
MLRSGFGKQVKTPTPSNPQWGFGTAHRDAGNKVRPPPPAARPHVPCYISQNMAAPYPSRGD